MTVFYPKVKANAAAMGKILLNIVAVPQSGHKK